MVLDSLRGVHGSANELWVAVWFLSMNWKVTLSPMFAVSVLGENSRAPFAPTMTTWEVPEELDDDADEVEDGDVEVAAAASVVYVVVCAAPFTVTVAVTVMTLAEETG